MERRSERMAEIAKSYHKKLQEKDVIGSISKR